MISSGCVPALLSASDDCNPLFLVIFVFNRHLGVHQRCGSVQYSCLLQSLDSKKTM